jgi:hypothetical protein
VDRNYAARFPSIEGLKLKKKNTRVILRISTILPLPTPLLRLLPIPLLLQISLSFTSIIYGDVREA